MNSRGRLLAGIGLFCVLALLALLVLPSFLEESVSRRVRAELDRALDARVEWSGARLGFFRNFPHLTLGLEELTVVGEDPFEGDTLASAQALELVLDLGSVVRSVRNRGPVVVRSVRLDAPELRLRVLEDGRANWDILAATAEEGGENGDPAEASPESETPGRSLAVELRDFEVEDGRLALDNERSGLHATLEGYRHSLSGAFARDTLVAETRMHADRTTVRLGGAPYLAGATLDFDAALAVGLAERRITLRDNELRLNDLLLRVAGAVDASGDDLGLDLAFEAPRSEFRQALSLVPALWTQDFASLETSGTFAVDGSVRGPWGPDAFPALSLHATVRDGSFRYPELPLPARDIAAELSVTNPGGDPDRTRVELRGLHLLVGEQPLDASATLLTPLSDPDLDVQVDGTLDLAALGRTVKLDGAGQLAGSVTAAVSVHARRSDVDSARWERVEAQGRVSARDVRSEMETLPGPLLVDEAELELSPRRAELRSLRGRVGSSDFQATGSLDNLLAFALRDAPLVGRGTVHSTRVVLDEWRSEREGLDAIPVPPMLDLTVDATAEQLRYGALEMADAGGRLRLVERRLTLDGFTLETLGGRIGMNGSYETTEPARPTFDLDLTLDSLDIPGASEALLTVRTLAPVARYARGAFSARLGLSGALGPDMTPIFDAMAGEGSLSTSPIALEGLPLLQKLGEALALPRLSNPTVEALRASIRIGDGRLHVRPFGVGIAGLRMSVEGSNGLDRSLDYTLGLTVPRSLLGERAAGVVKGLADRAGRVGLDLPSLDSLRLGVRVGGTFSEPTLDLGLAEAAGSVGRAAGEAVGAEVQRRLDEAQERLDSTRVEAEARARARADSLVAAAEERADQVRAEARRLAEEVRQEADRRIEELLARATNPIARAAAKPAADRLRREAEERADRLVTEADERADALVADARRRAEELVGGEPSPQAPGPRA